MRTFTVLVLCIFGMNHFLFSQEPDYVILPEADTWIGGGADADVPKGAPGTSSWNFLSVKAEGQPGEYYWREIMIRFDLSAVTETIGTAQLKLYDYKNWVDTPDTVVFGCYLIESDSWNEETTTWNNAPLPNFDFELFTEDLRTTRKDINDDSTQTKYGWTEGGFFDVEKLENERKGDGKLSVDIFAKTIKVSFNDPDPWTGFISKDSTGADSLHPRLYLWESGNDTTGIEVFNRTNQFAGFLLQQNYPNPFNPVTTIPMTLPEKSEVSLTVYNIQGRQVETLVNQLLSAGHHRIQWDASRFESGIYFYEMKAGAYREIKKLLLIQ